MSAAFLLLLTQGSPLGSIPTFDERLISVNAIRAFTGFTADDVSSAKLSAIRHRVVDAMERRLGFYLGLPTAREYVTHGSMYGHAPRTVIVLPDDVIPPTQSAPIVVEQLNETTWEWEPIPANEWRRVGRKIMHRTGFPLGQYGIRVRYRSGYAVDVGPGELTDLALRIVLARVRESFNTRGVQSETLSDYSYSRGDESGILAGFADELAALTRRLPL